MYKELGFSKIAVSISATKGLIRDLKQEGYTLVRNNPKSERALKGLSAQREALREEDATSFSDPINKLIGIPRIKNEYNFGRREELFHEAGHAFDRENQSPGIIEFFGKPTLKHLRDERAANNVAMAVMRRVESPEILEKSIRDYANAMKKPYNTYKSSFLEGVLRTNFHKKYPYPAPPDFPKGINPLKYIKFYKDVQEYARKVNKIPDFDISKVTLSEVKQLYKNNPDLFKKSVEV